ncbi:putative transcriptional regulator [Methanolacinia petrolearia DSM 11571]|uniref:Putative transcriptional regulator n=1 Tax=Methanolacinia petrolearia (strain DSM 11571 / OCM 486 / SEBR 4847) TaxID=679926 RepID=E1RFP1_METP4|nr:PAS domain-containing protein [Methanolacinia petrolearia]ADN37345.1 putative transcriptional regulator [Methanolacinia petrolearia DSM 11571]
MSLREISEAISMNRVTVARHLDVLMASGRVEMVPFGQAKVFYLSQRVPVASLINCLSDVILVVDDRMKIRQFNTAFLKLFGETAEDYYGLPVHDVFLSDDNGNHSFESLDMALRGKYMTEDIAINRGDEKICLKVDMYPCIFENGERSVSLVMTDVSFRKKSEEFLRINTEMIRKMSAEFSSDEILILGAETAKNVLNADAAAIFLNNDADTFSNHYCTGNGERFGSDFNEIWGRNEFNNQILNGNPVYYSYAGTEACGETRGAPGLSGPGSFLSYPLLRKGIVAGFIAVFSKKPDIPEIERNELELISCQISYALSKETFGKYCEKEL